MSPLLEAAGLRKSYGALEVLKGVDLRLSEGLTLAMIGPNGAGKTTLFKVLTGEAPASGGSVRFMGRDITREPAFRRVRLGIARTFQVARVFHDMTALDNIVVAVERRRSARGESTGPWRAVRPAAAVRAEAGDWLAEVGLTRVAGVEARLLSHGDKKRLELAGALALEPRVLMLDEPTAGMSPSDRHETVRLLARIKSERGVTILMTEHDMDVVFGLADVLMVLNYGEIIAQGAPAQIRADPTVRAVYLGREAG